MPVLDIAQVLTSAAQGRWTEDNTENFMNSADIPKDTERFLTALETSGVDYLLVGGIALLQYVEGRNTLDIDFILAVEDAEKIEGFHLTDTNPHFAQGRFGKLQIDLLRPENDFFAEIRLTENRVCEFLGRSLKTATPRGLVLLKLYALPSLYRQGNISRATLYEGDVTLLLDKHPCKKESLLDTLGPHLSRTDLNEISKIIDEIEAKLSRYR